MLQPHTKIDRDTLLIHRCKKTLQGLTARQVKPSGIQFQHMAIWHGVNGGHPSFTSDEQRISHSYERTSFRIPKSISYPNRKAQRLIP